MRKKRVVVIDPPWKHGDSLPGKGRGAVKHYPCLTLDQIVDACKDMGIIAERYTPSKIIHADCWLFLWNLHTHKQEALALAHQLGFDPRPAGELIWRKVTNDGTRARIGMGRSVRMAHESCLIFKRGKPERQDASIPSIFDAPRGAHSAKPDAFYKLVDRLVPGPKVELFARRQWKRWECLGLEMKRRRVA